MSFAPISAPRAPRKPTTYAVADKAVTLSTTSNGKGVSVQLRMPLSTDLGLFGEHAQVCIGDGKDAGTIRIHADTAGYKVHGGQFYAKGLTHSLNGEDRKQHRSEAVKYRTRGRFLYVTLPDWVEVRA